MDEEMEFYLHEKQNTRDGVGYRWTRQLCIPTCMCTLFLSAHFIVHQAWITCPLFIDSSLLPGALPFYISFTTEHKTEKPSNGLRISTNRGLQIKCRPLCALGRQPFTQQRLLTCSVRIHHYDPNIPSKIRFAKKKRHFAILKYTFPPAAV